MTVVANAEYSVYPFRDTLKQAYCVDGYFQETVSLTGDASGGVLLIRTRTPDADKLFRAYKFRSVRVGPTSADAARVGMIIVGVDDSEGANSPRARAIGATNHKQSWSMEVLASSTDIEAGVQDMHIRGANAGGPHLVEVLDRIGWLIVPGEPVDGAQDITVVYEMINPGAALTYSLHVYGYWVDLRSSQGRRRFPGGLH